MQEESLNIEEIARKNDYWVELDRKYRAQVRKTRSIVLEKGKGVEVWDAEDVIDRTTSGQPAAMLIEIMQGVGGTIVPPVEWVKRLRQICNEREMLLIIDESLTGMGRTGKWFGFEYYDIVPDILTTSKALGQGVPVAAVITTDVLKASNAISCLIGHPLFFVDYVIDYNILQLFAFFRCRALVES